MGKTIQVSGFPHLLSGEHVKEFLERQMGLTGRGTIFAIQVKNGKQGMRAYARVQFTDIEYAAMFKRLANLGILRYGTSYLKVWDQDIDIVPNPRTYEDEMEGVTLSVGNQISKENFSVLWEAENVSIRFGYKLKNMQMFLTHESNEYKLQLYHDNIWQIVLCNSGYQAGKVLLIQLCGAPRIYRKLEDSVHSYFKETPDDQWVRTTDFTPSSSIGQSSAICLHLPPGTHLPNFADNFAYYKESKSPFFLEDGVPFCKNLELVPIVQPPRGLELPYIRFDVRCRCYEEMPLQEMQAAQEQQTIQNLSDTLRTILRL